MRGLFYCKLRENTRKPSLNFESFLLPQQHVADSNSFSKPGNRSEKEVGLAVQRCVNVTNIVTFVVVITK